MSRPRGKEEFAPPFFFTKLSVSSFVRKIDIRLWKHCWNNMFPLPSPPFPSKLFFSSSNWEIAQLQLTLCVCSLSGTLRSDTKPCRTYPTAFRCTFPRTWTHKNVTSTRTATREIFPSAKYSMPERRAFIRNRWGWSVMMSASLSCILSASAALPLFPKIPCLLGPQPFASRSLAFLKWWSATSSWWRLFPNLDRLARFLASSFVYPRVYEIISMDPK